MLTERDRGLGMSIKSPTRAFLLVVPVLILLAIAFNLGWNLVLGVTPPDQALEMGLLAAVLAAGALGLGLVYIRVDARLRRIGDFGPWPRAKTR
jgi:hypothetical protein